MFISRICIHILIFKRSNANSSEGDSDQTSGFIFPKFSLDGATPICVAKFRDHRYTADPETDSGGEDRADSHVRAEVVLEGIEMRITAGIDNRFTDVVMESDGAEGPARAKKRLPRGGPGPEVIFAQERKFPIIPALAVDVKTGRRNDV